MLDFTKRGGAGVYSGWAPPAGPIWLTHNHQPGLPDSAGAEAAVVDSRSRSSTHSLHLTLRGAGHYSDLTPKTTQNVHWINDAKRRMKIA